MCNSFSAEPFSFWKILISGGIEICGGVERSWSSMEDPGDKEVWRTGDKFDIFLNLWITAFIYVVIFEITIILLLFVKHGRLHSIKFTWKAHTNENNNNQTQLCKCSSLLFLLNTPSRDVLVFCCYRSVMALKIWSVHG